LPSQRLSGAEVEKLRVESKLVPVNQWSVSGAREVLHRTSTVAS
jgi:hypothetical protein